MPDVERESADPFSPYECPDISPPKFSTSVSSWRTLAGRDQMDLHPNLRYQRTAHGLSRSRGNDAFG